MLSASCSIFSGQTQPSERAKEAAVCKPTKAVRRNHIEALIALGDTPQEARAKTTGAQAMRGVAVGCGEVEA